MKKITFLLLFLTISYSIKAQFSEGFEDGIPNDWSVINNGSANGWVQNTDPSGGAFGGTSVASITYGTIAHDDYLITPPITVSAGVNDFLLFNIKSRSSAYIESYEILLSTTDVSEASFTVELQASSAAPAVWTANSFDLSSYVGQTVYVAVKATDTDKFELYVDDVLSGVAPVAPECATSPFPADVAVSVPNGVVTFTWEAPASGVTPTSYDLYGGETTSLEFGLIGNFTSLSADLTISGFDATIYWQIVPNNYGVAAEGCPIWSFTTVSPPLPIVPTYSADFSSYPADRWTEASGAYGEPSGDSSGFAGDDFGNDTGHANGRSARINIWGTSTDEYLISPAFNLEGASYYLNFDIAYTAFSTTAAATFGSDDYVALLVTEDGTTWTELMRWDDSVSLSNTGESISELALTGYGADVKFAFYGFSDTSNEDNNFYIDNFQITTTTLGVAKNSIENFSLFPTLVKDEISFTSQKIVDTFMVYNLLGQQVFSKKINAKTAALDLTMLKKGMYLVKVISGNSTGSYKIIKE